MKTKSLLLYCINQYWLSIALLSLMNLANSTKLCAQIYLDSLSLVQPKNHFSLHLGYGRVFPMLNTAYAYNPFSGVNVNLGFSYERVINRKTSIIAKSSVEYNRKQEISIQEKSETYLPGDFLTIYIHPNLNFQLGLGLKYNWFFKSIQKPIFSTFLLLGAGRGSYTFSKQISQFGYTSGGYPRTNPTTERFQNHLYLNGLLSKEIIKLKKGVISTFLGCNIMLTYIENPTMGLSTRYYPTVITNYKNYVIQSGFILNFK